MMWTCKSCAGRAGVAIEGQATAAAGWCGAGHHAVRETIAWVPEISPASRTVSCGIGENSHNSPTAPPPLVPAQLSMF